MPTGRASLMPALRRVVLVGTRADRTDGQLLGAFVADRDADSFGLLVRRHGPMVLGVCRRVIGDHHCAEDAFQAVFLVLARRAASVRPREQVGNWLYGVAYRTALKARGVLARRRSREKQVEVMPEPPAATPPTDWADLQPVIDEELARLPEKLRGPVVLCDIEGRPQREVAKHLGVPPATLATRLATARRTLAQRLTKRGVALSGGAVAGLLTVHGSAAAVPHALAHGLTRAAEAVATGGAVSTLVSASAVQLSEGVMRMMLLTKLKTVAVVIMTAVALTGGLGLGLVPARAGNAGEDPAPAPAATAKVVPAQIPPAADETPDPNVAVARARARARLIADNPVDDAEFLRRLSLDIRGVLPTDIEMFFFVDDEDKNKRAKLVEWLVDDESARLFAAEQLGVDAGRVVRVQSLDAGDGKPRAIVVVIDTSGSMQPKPRVTRAAFSPDGKKLAAAGPPNVEARAVQGKWIELLTDDVVGGKGRVVRVQQAAQPGAKDSFWLDQSGGFFQVLPLGADGKVPDKLWALIGNDPKNPRTLSLGTEKGIRVWDTVTGQAIGDFDEDGRPDVLFFSDGVARATVESDLDFLKRAVQAARGRAPSSLEQKYFTEDKDPKKREKLLDTLLKEPEVVKKLGDDFKKRMLAGPGTATAPLGDRTFKYFVLPDGKDMLEFQLKQPSQVAPSWAPKKVVPVDPKAEGQWKFTLPVGPDGKPLTVDKFGEFHFTLPVQPGQAKPWASPVPPTPATPPTPPTPGVRVLPVSPPKPAPPATPAVGRFEKLVGELLAAKKTDAEMLEAVTLAAAGRLPTETEKRLTLALVSKSADRKAAWVEVAKVLAGEGKMGVEFRNVDAEGVLEVDFFPAPRK